MGETGGRWRRAAIVVAVLFVFSALFQLLAQIRAHRSFEDFWYPWDGALWLFSDGLFSVLTVVVVQRLTDRAELPSRYARVLLLSLVAFVPLSVGEQLLNERYVFDKTHNMYTVLRYAAFQASWHLVVANGFLAYRYLSALGRARERLATVERDRAAMELRQLQRSVSPHFLFNSLNILQALIGDNPDRAAEFTARLARLYRYLLRHQNDEVVPLQDELEFVRDYRYLVEQRFGHAWMVEIDETPTEPYVVVPGAIQSLLENAVKHNAAREGDPLRVSVHIEGDRLVVTNDRRDKADSAGSGQGLALLRARYARLDDRPIEIDTEPSQFRVTLPLIRPV